MTEATAVYVRVVSASADDQRERALAYVEDELELDRDAVTVFADTGTEARTNGSSGYRELRSLVGNGALDRVIVTDASRIAKTMPDFHDLAEAFLEHDTALHVIEPGLRIGEDTAETGAERAPENGQVLDAIGIAAELAASVNAERTREGIDAAKASGKHVGRPPFGFDSEDGRLVPNGDFGVALDVIERIENGQSKRSTAQYADVSRATVQSIVDRTELYRAHADAPQ